MDKNKLNELLDSIYELEGLVHLALNRDDNPAHLPELIKLKGEELGRRAAGMVSTDEPELPQAKTDQPVNPEPQEHHKEEMPLYIVESAEGEMTADESGVEEEMQSVVDSVFDALPVEDNVLNEDIEINSSEEIEDSKGDIPHVISVPTEEKIAKGPMAVVKEPKGRLVFSINDRYLFKRELFANSDADFNNTLSLVASMENYEEAEDYFLGELQWDQKKSEVIGFLEIIKKYFKE